MNAITIYYYTAWNGYSWQGCDATKSADLQRYMEAAGVLPGDPGRKPPFGGAIACQVSGKMGVAVYRCGIRSKGDAFGRDSVFIALAFIPLECGPVDFAALLSMPQMLPSGRGELVPAQVPLQGLSMPSEASQKQWREESFAEKLSGASGLTDASVMFFSRSCQLGLLQASFSSESGEIGDVVTTLSYRAFPEVLSLVEASKKYYEAKRNAIGPISVDHPARVALWNALYELRTKRVEKMSGYAGLAEYAAAKDAELNSGVAKVGAYSQRTVAHTQQRIATPVSAKQGQTKQGVSVKRQSSLLPHVLGVIILLLVGAFAVSFIVVSRNHSAEVKELGERIVELEDQCRTGKSEKNGIEIRRDKLQSELELTKSDFDRAMEDKSALERKVLELESNAKSYEAHAQELEIALLNATNRLAAAKSNNEVLWKRLDAAEGLLTSVRLKAEAFLDLTGTEEEKENLRKSETTFSNSRKDLADGKMVEKTYLESYRKVVDAYVGVLDKAIKDVEELKKLQQEQKKQIDKASRETQQTNQQQSAAKQQSATKQQTTGKQQATGKQQNTGKQRQDVKQQPNAKTEGADDKQPQKQEAQPDPVKQEDAEPDFVLPSAMKFCEKCGLDLKDHRNSRECPRCHMLLVPFDQEPADVKNPVSSGGKAR